MIKKNWLEVELEFIRALKDRKNCGTWMDVANQFNRKFDASVTADMVAGAYRRYADLCTTMAADQPIRSIKQLRRARATSSYNAREVRLMADQMNAEGEIVERIQGIAKKLGKHRAPKYKPKKYRNRFEMVLELLLSDIHFGRLASVDGHVLFNEAIGRRRLKEVAAVVLKELAINQTHYNIKRMVVALLGDIIQSFTMHGLESARECEYGTARQVWAATDSLLFDVLIPLAETGLRIDVPAVTGNHDRSENKRTYVNPGENNWTLVIYKTLEALLKGRGYTNVTFHIPTGPYTVLDVFGNNVLYEHLDNAKLTRDSLEKLMMKRGTQTGKMIDFLRGGHYHEYTMHGNGRAIVNMGLPGFGSFSDVIGYKGEAGQVLNYYLDFPLALREGQRKNTFHKTFGIKLV